MSQFPEFIQTIPVLPALSIPEAVSFYVERLGFSNLFQVGDYAGLKRGGVEIHLWHCNDRALAERSGCRIAITGIEPLYREYQEKNVLHPKGTLTEKPWGTKEFVVLDDSGNCLTFFEPTVPNR